MISISGPRMTPVVVIFALQVLRGWQGWHVESFQPRFPASSLALQVRSGGGSRETGPPRPSRTRHPTRISQSTSPSTTPKQKSVLLSKVIRSPPNQEHAFLPQLLEYLQDKFQLPNNLVMTYEKDQGSSSSPSAAADDDDGVVVSWSCPLAENSRLSVQVVPIVMDDDSSDSNDSTATSTTSNVPSMAMVALSKIAVNRNDKNYNGLMMNNLLQSSEQSIVKALDRGLELLVQGKVKGLFSPTSTISSSMSSSSSTTNGEWQTMSRDALKDLELAEQEIVTLKEGESFTKVITPPSNPTRNNDKKPTDNKKDEDDLPVEFAVAAAKAAAAAKKRRQEQLDKNDSAGGEYAVQAAQKIAALKKNKNDTTSTTSDSRTAPETWKDDAKKTPETTTTRPLVSEAQRKLGRPSWSISSPETRHRQPGGLSTKKSSQLHEAREVKDDFKTEVVVAEVPHEAAEPKTMKDSYVDAELVPESNPKEEAPPSQKMTTTKKKLNLKVVNDEKDAIPFPTYMKNPVNYPDDTDVNDEEFARAKEAQRVMEEIADQQGQEMTAEELLQNVLKFESEQKEDGGFVSGAFEKAKELLRERKQQRDERSAKQFKEANGRIQMDVVAEGDGPVSEEKEQLSPEEELRRLFQAGEQAAENRGQLLDATLKEERELTRDQEQDVNKLLASEKTISSHARTLDEELAELEVRINRNPLEDGSPPQNPMFDIMSGPEVYNPNVDPETAVNWPGALPGTKTNVRLAKELQEAVKQAKFAAGVIMKMKEEVVVVNGAETVEYRLGDNNQTILSHEQVVNFQTVVREAVKLGLIPDPVEYMAEQSRLQILVDELWHQPEERFKEIAENYKDLLLSENLIGLLRERLTDMADRDAQAAAAATGKQHEDEHEENESTASTTPQEGRHEREREILTQVVVYTQLLLKEARALGAQLEAQQLEVIRSICKVAMDPSFTTEAETAAALTDAVRGMRPLFDDAFVAYLKYAVAEERGRLARAGILDDPEHNTWYMVLTIVQQGVYAEIAKGINRYIEHIWYVLRMETRRERRNLLAEFIDVMPTLDVRPFVQVVDNIAASLGDAANGDMAETDAAALGEMANKILQLHRDVHDLLPPDRLNEMAKDADEWAAKQQQRLLEQRKLTQKRLQESRDTEHLAEAVLKRAGEVERFE